MFSEEIIISLFRGDIMPIPIAFKEIMKDIRSRRDDDIDQISTNHLADDFAHPTRDHRSGEAKEDDALRVSEHLLKDIITSMDAPALKGGMFEGSDQIEETPGLRGVQMSDGLSEIFLPAFLHESLQGRSILAEINK